MTDTEMAYDLVLTGGTILDPAQGLNDRRDIAFKDGLVAAVAERIDPQSAAAVDIPGKLVTPRVDRPARPLLSRRQRHRRPCR